MRAYAGAMRVKSDNICFSRRDLLVAGSCFAWGAVAAAALPARLLAAELAVLDVAYAGSMGSLMEGPVKRSARLTLDLDLQGRGQGSNALAELIVGGSIRPDVFIPITPGPMLRVLRGGKAEIAIPVARTEMVIAYSPKSRFASKLSDASRGKGEWWKVLQEPGLRFGRTDPVTDPQGRNIIFTMMLAAKLYRQAELVERVLGPTINEKQIFSEPTVQARLQSGELDAASAYKTQPKPFNLPYIALPKEINLGGQDVHTEHPDVGLSVGGKTYSPEPLIYYASALKDVPNPKGAVAFINWLKGDEGQAIFRQHDYDSPADISALHL